MQNSGNKPSLAQLKLHTKAYYNRIGIVHCPILDEDVHFTSEGYDHLINESNSQPGRSRPRNPAEQYKKLMCLMDAKTILKYSEKVAEIRTVKKKVKGKWKNATQSEVVHELKGEQISVIVEKVGNGNSKFMSVFSDWHKTKNTR